MNFVEEKTRAETIFQRELTDVEFAEVLMNRLEQQNEQIEALNVEIENLETSLKIKSEPDIWDDIRNNVEEVLGMDGRSSVTVRFDDDGTVKMDFNVYGLTLAESDCEEDDLF